MLLNVCVAAALSFAPGALIPAPRAPRCPRPVAVLERPEARVAADLERTEGCDVNIGWCTTASGIKYVDEVVGTGAQPGAGEVVKLHYTVTLLTSGTQLGTSRGGQPLTFALAKHDVPVWDEALRDMRIGGRRRLVVPPTAVPESQKGRLPRENEPLRFDIELLGLETGPMSLVAQALPPGNRRQTILRGILALSFVPYALPDGLKPGFYKGKDMSEVVARRRARQDPLGTLLDSL